MNIHVKEAGKVHQNKGWVLDYHQLVDIQERLIASELHISLETIEAVLLASGRKEHLINFK